MLCGFKQQQTAARFGYCFQSLILRVIRVKVHITKNVFKKYI